MFFIRRVFATTAVLLLAACGNGEHPAVPLQEAGQKSADAPELPVNESVYPDVAKPGPEIDPVSGLVIDKHWELVMANCGACHSTQLVTQNRGSRQQWLDMIRWMQESQGLWVLDEGTETAILDYLEKNYAPSALHRRAPIAPDLMPENPYTPGD